MAPRDARDYLQDMIDYIAAAERMIDGMTFEEFEADEKTVLALIRAVEVVGEAAKNVPIALREKYPDIQWKQLIGMRDRLAHGYFTIDLTIVWNAVLYVLPEFKPTLQTMLNQLEIET